MKNNKFFMNPIQIKVRDKYSIIDKIVITKEDELELIPKRIKKKLF